MAIKKLILMLWALVATAAFVLVIISSTVDLLREGSASYWEVFQLFLLITGMYFSGHYYLNSEEITSHYDL